MSPRDLDRLDRRKFEEANDFLQGFFLCPFCFDKHDMLWSVDTFGVSAATSNRISFESPMRCSPYRALLISCDLSRWPHFHTFAAQLLLSVQLISVPAQLTVARKRGQILSGSGCRSLN